MSLGAAPLKSLGKPGVLEDLVGSNARSELLVDSDSDVRRWIPPDFVIAASLSPELIAACPEQCDKITVVVGHGLFSSYELIAHPCNDFHRYRKVRLADILKQVEDHTR